MQKDNKLYIAGHRGLVGSATVRQLESRGFSNLLLRTHQEFDLTSQQAVREFFAEQKMIVPF